jgi:hypothetical protein
MYYTYAHSSPQGKVFYIGKGVDNRAFAFSDRNDAWKRAIKQHKGLLIDVLAKWETEAEAYEHEKFLIACFKDMKYSLANLTDGGQGSYGYKPSEKANKLRSEKNTGFVHKIVTCPKCGKIGGETSMKRWHFEKCTGLKQFKARATTLDGKRIQLGKFATQAEAHKVMVNFYVLENRPLPKELIRHLRNKT